MKKIFFDMLVCMSLIVIGFVVGVLCYQESYITTLLQYHDANVYTEYFAKPITQNTAIRGQVVAAYDNFASVKLRVSTFNRINTTHIIFRLKEKGSKDWLVVNTYTIDRFASGLLYPFGFSPIVHSAGKQYEFEVTSTDGVSDNALGILAGYHTVASQYVFTKATLLENKQLLTEFTKQKIKTTFGDVYVFLYMGLLGVPALWWLARRIIRNKAILPYVYAALCMYLFLVYSYLPLDLHSNMMLFMAGAICFIGFLSQAPAAAAYIFALAALVQIPFVIFFGNTLAANRLSILAFCFMIVGGIISISELKKDFYNGK